MGSFWVTAVASLVTFAWVVPSARHDWRSSSRLGRSTTIGIAALYVLTSTTVVRALLVHPLPVEVPIGVALALGGALLAGGALVAVLGARQFDSSSMIFGEETGSLVEVGIYRYSRNPQYAGLILVVLATGALSRSGLTLAVACAIAAALWLWVVAVEEPHLTRTFGPRYRRYRERVPRFLGPPGQPTSG